MFAFLPASLQICLFLSTFFLGAFFGSALHCLAYRMARGEKWSEGRSRCPRCGHTLHALDLIPVFSWLLLKGKCRHCGGKIPVRYLLAEAGLGLVFVSLLLRLGLTLQALSSLVLCCCLFCLSLVDWETQIIPDRFLIIPAAVRILQLILTKELAGGILPALIFGGGLLALSLLMDRLLKKDTMGGGDIKLMAVLGLYFSIPECLLLLMIACILGILAASVFMKRKGNAPFPFGPWLSIAAYITLLFGSQIVNWYWGLFIF